MLKEKKYEMLNGDKIYYLTERFFKIDCTDGSEKEKYQILSRTIKTINKKISRRRFGVPDGYKE